MEALEELRRVFDLYNVSIDLVYNGDMSNPHLELTYEDGGQHIYLDHYWEGRIKAYNLIPKEDKCKV